MHGGCAECCQPVRSFTLREDWQREYRPRKCCHTGQRSGSSPKISATLGSNEHNRSAAAEHRAVLEAALRKTSRESLAAVLASMPDAGCDEDFARQEDKAEGSVFD